MRFETAKLVEKAYEKSSWPTVEIDGLQLLQAPSLTGKRLKHAFTTRKGGNTPAPFDSFNLGRHDAAVDHWNDALENRKKLCSALDVPFADLRVPGQVHSKRVVFAEDSQQLKEVDAVATVSSNVPVLLHYADCVPIIIFDPRRSALAVVHAGWRGTAAMIASEAVTALVTRAGSEAWDLIAAVGPAIGSCCYPTSAEAAKSLASTVTDGELFITLRDGQPCPDLRAINAMQLLERGLSVVDVSDLCTACNPDIFYSHRQSGGQTGRQGAIACLI
ncbi:MAG TPA: peptidoglycan editing factor PgeF [Candidatus Melainabacteria bacterium]|nr:peptidoglycan editing factor PgeF [Candidatus Melainabacteria bacterium]